MKISKYHEDINVAAYHTDINSILKPASFLDWAQEAAGLHADSFGFGYEKLIQTKTAWILSRMNVKFHKMPRWKDKVSIESWHKGLDRLFFLRDFTLTSESGERLVSATSSWLILNLETRRISRSPELSDNNEICIHEDVIETPAAKLVFPKDAETEVSVSHKVVYSDLDMNGHVNNVRYTVWAMDALPLEVTNSNVLKELTINFNSEVRIGDTVEIFVHRDDNPSPDVPDSQFSYYVEGRVDGKSSFIEQLVF